MTDRASLRRVLQVHTRYRHLGGEDAVVEAERRLLEDAGVEVDQVLFDNATLREGRSPLGDLQLAAAAVWSPAAAGRVRHAIARARPDIVHVHNTFPAASPAVFSACVAAQVPAVWTQHNYRLFCPAATAFRNGRECTDCLRLLVPWPAVAHACVRHSRGQSLAAGATTTLNRLTGTIPGRIAMALALTPFQRSLLVDAGYPSQWIRVVPNFLEPDPGTGGKVRRQVVFVGRLSPEKGIDALCRSARMARGAIRVIGDGPLEAKVHEAAADGTLVHLGRLDPGAVRNELRLASAVVLPSVWYEGFPLVVLEAFASATPIIASRIGSLADIVEDGETGWFVDPGDADALARRIRWVLEHPDVARRAGERARERYERLYRGPQHLAALTEAYAAAAERAA